MAKQTGLIQFTGKLGNVIGYRRNGAWCMRSLPEKVHQTTATRQASRNFGIASRKGKLIRQAIVPLLDIFPGGSMGNCLNKALIHAGKNLQSLEGFRFNRYTGVEKFFSIRPVILPGGIIQIPAQSLPEREAGTLLEIKAIAVRINFTTGKITGSRTASITANPQTPFNGATLELMIPGKDTLMLVLQARLIKAGTPSHNRNFVAADILSIYTPIPTRKKPVKAGKKPALRKIPACWSQKHTSHHCRTSKYAPVALLQQE